MGSIFLAASFSGYDIPSMLFGIAILFLIGLASFSAINSRILNQKIAIIALPTFLSLYFFFSTPLFLLAIIAVLLTTIDFRELLLIVWKRRPSLEILLMGFMFICFIVSLFASTFLEEEHEIWFYFFPTFTLILAFHSLKEGKSIRSLIGILILIRIIRYWNSTGFQCANDPDVRKFLLSNESMNQTLFIFALFSTILMFIISRKNKYQSLIVLLFSAFCLAYKAPLYIYLNSVVIAQICYSLLAALLISSLLKLIQTKNCLTFIDDLIYEFCFLQFLLQKMHNALLIFIILIAYYLYQKWSIKNNSSSYKDWFFTLCLSELSYFASGQSNLIATIDLSNAYTGIDGYNPEIVGFLLILITWGFPLVCWGRFFSLVLRKGNKSHFINCVALTLTFKCISQAFVALSCFTLRYHLFIWSVMSPRFLYEIFWQIIYTFVILVMFVLDKLC